MYSRYIGFCAAEYQMPKERKSPSRKRSGRSTALSTRTKKQLIIYLSMRSIFLPRHIPMR